MKNSKILFIFTIFLFLFGLNINSMGTASKGNIRSVVKYEGIDSLTGSEINLIRLDPEYVKCLQCSEKKGIEVKFSMQNLRRHLTIIHRVKGIYKATLKCGSVFERPIKISGLSSSSSISKTTTTKRKLSDEDGKKFIKKKCIRGKKIMALKGTYKSDNSASIKMERSKFFSRDLTPPFVCNACTGKYDIVSSAKRHLRQVHKVDEIEEIPFDSLKEEDSNYQNTTITDASSDSTLDTSIPLTTALIASKIHSKLLTNDQTRVSSSSSSLSSLSSIDTVDTKPLSSPSSTFFTSSIDDKEGKEELELTDAISNNVILKVTETEANSENIEVFNNIKNPKYTLTIKELGEDKEISLLPGQKVSFEKGIADFTVYLKDNKNQVIKEITFSDQRKSVTLTTQFNCELLD